MAAQCRNHGLPLGVLLCCLVVLSAFGAGQAQEGKGGVLRVDLNMYTPGTIPQGIGEPNKVATTLAEEWEAGNPGYTIKFQQLINTGSAEGEWLVTQLIGGMAPEILHQNAESMWPHVGKDWYVPLDEFLDRPNPYVEGNEHWIDIFSNQALVGSKRAPDGKLYCIPMDIVETGVFYNKTLLASIGVHEFPTTWTGMMALLSKAREARIIPMTADGNLGSDWGQDIIFEMLYRDILPLMDLAPSRPDAEGYLGHYLEPYEFGFLFSKGFFTARDPRWREMNRLLREWREGWAQELKNTDPIRLFLTQRLAWYWSGSWFIRRMATDPYIDFEWGVGYIPTITKESSRFGSGTPATVIGGAAMQFHVTNSAILNDNVEQCIDFLMYITAPQQIERLASEALIFIPNINGAKTDARLDPFQEIFQRPYCAIKLLESFDGAYKKYWRRMLDYYLHDGVDLEGYLEMLEENFAAWVDHHREDAGWKLDELEPVWREREAELLRELDAQR